MELRERPKKNINEPNYLNSINWIISPSPLLSLLVMSPKEGREKEREGAECHSYNSKEGSD